MKEEEDEQNITTTSWADLPYDILCHIFSRLVGAERGIFRCVCRSWKPVQIPPLGKPIVVSTKQLYTRSTSLSMSTTYLMNSKAKILHPIYGHHAALFAIQEVCLIVHAAKDGWLLITLGNNEIDIPTFFFNPLTNAKLELPSLPGRPQSCYISAVPTSTHWTVIAGDCPYFGSIAILSIKCGEESWNQCEFLLKEKEPEFDFTYGTTAVVCKGLYYFLGKYAKLLIHDPRKKTFYIEDPPVISQQLRGKDAGRYIVESNGKVVGVFVSCDGSIIRILRWDVYKRKWEAIESLGDRILYVSRASCICERASVKGMGNKIYLPRLIDNCCCFYSLSTKKYHTFASASSYTSFKGSTYPRNPIWIQL